MKLKHEFGIFMSLLVAVVIIGISSAFFIYEKKLLIREMKNNELNIFKSFVRMSEEALSLRDKLLLLHYINFTKHVNRNLVYMIYKTVDGHILSSPKRDMLAYAIKKKDSGDRIFYSPSGERIFDKAADIMIDGKNAGKIRAGFSQDVLDEQVRETLKKTSEKIFGIAAVSLCISLGMAFFLANRMSGPIKKLSRGAKLIGQGDLGQRINVNAKNELRDLAEEFNSMAVKLKELDEMKDNFISSVSHELKSPLSYIKGYIDLLVSENRTLSETHRTYFDIIEQNIARLSDFISDILDIAKIKAGRFGIEKKSCDLRKMAANVADLCMPAAVQKKITIDVAVPDSITPAGCDEVKITQVLANLAGNALKFTPGTGKITIGALDAGDHLEVWVQDTGIGIPKDKLGSVFDRFVQVKSLNVKGTGLGLAVVKGIIDAHGQKIWVESEPDKGAKFIFTLEKA
jgi:signal transduction histidine kinase